MNTSKNNPLFLKLLLICQILILPATIWAGRWQDVHVNGIAASISWRYSDNPSLVPERNRLWQGKLVTFTVRDNKVTKCDTLYKGLADFPSFSTDGKQIAFWLEGDRVEGNKMVYSDTDWIAIINTDGTGLKKLKAFTGKLSQNWYNSQGHNRQVHWRLGWLYYIKPWTADIWRIKPDDPSKDEFVVSYAYGLTDRFIRRWTMSADAKHVGFQFKPGPTTCPGSQTYLEFPGNPDPCLTGIFKGYITSCNAAISASGNFATAYTANGHTCAVIESINWTTKTLARDIREELTVCVDTVGMKMGIPYDSLPHGTATSGGGEWIRWASNSDKWYLHQMGMGAGEPLDFFGGYGSNQLLFNWTDYFILFTSKNKKNLDQAKTSICYGNTAGDFFVEGGPVGHYEDTLGRWIPIPGYSASVKENSKHFVSSKEFKLQYGQAGKITLTHPYEGLPIRVGIHKLNGALVKAFDVKATAWNLPEKILPKGMLIIQIQEKYSNKTHNLQLIRN